MDYALAEPQWAAVMKTVDIRTAKAHLSSLIEEAAAEEEIVIAKAGKGIARLMPLRQATQTKRKLGVLAGQLKIPSDFDAPLPADVLNAFEGRRMQLRPSPTKRLRCALSRA
jgi:prevent-host-death family protein